MKEHGAFPDRCPYCSSPIIGDRETGELVCPTCGAVLEESLEFEGPEWKAIDPEDKLRKSRAGPPLTYTQHDFGLTTSIDTSGTDFQGNRLNGDGRANAARMNMWHSRMRTVDSKERSMANVLQKISDIAKSLNLPPNVVETAAYNFRQYAKDGQTKGRSAVVLAAAMLYLSCKQCDVNRSLAEIAQKSGLERKVVGKYYRQIVRGMELEHVPSASMANHIAKLSNILGISPRVERLAAELSGMVSEAPIGSGKSPAGLAAAYIYIASTLLNEHIQQREISENANITEVTIRKRCREIFDSYDVIVALKPKRSSQGKNK
ncbi:MAG: TFIIB-type zinc ribbon-containing protein [Conexivisphaerales archaeon]